MSLRLIALPSVGTILFQHWGFFGIIKYPISAESDVKYLMQIVKDVGGLPLLHGPSWNESEWSLADLLMRIRQTLGQQMEEVFDIASFIINLKNANNVSLP